MEEDERERGPLDGADRVAEDGDGEEDGEDLAEGGDGGDDDGAGLAEELVDAEVADGLADEERREVAADGGVRLGGVTTRKGDLSGC